MVYAEFLVVEAIKKINLVTGKKILLLGAYGMLGHALQRVFPHAIKKGSHDVDITDEKKIHDLITKGKYDVIINAAAYTQVEKCEDLRDLAFRVNGDAPGYIANSCREVNATLIHYSTDYVFDGIKKEYYESDLPKPINTYGKSKYLGETNIIKNMDDYRIIRTSWLFGNQGKNFIDTIMKLSSSSKSVNVVNDQYGKPTYTVDLAEKTKEIINSNPGIYHITNDGMCTWYELACAVIDNAIPCTTKEFPSKINRPHYSILMNTKTNPLRHWRLAVASYLRTRVVGTI